MQIAPNRVVMIDYTLKDEDGNVLDSSEGREPLAYLQGAGNIIPGLEEALEGRKEGESLEVNVTPDKAYGEKDERLQQDVSKDVFQTDQKIEPGMRFQAVGEQGAQIITVVKVEGDTVTVDANHPLAGQNLNFNVKVVGVRDATEQEIEQGQPADGEEE
jgi:FKBP-type peptidyl-prolyl cis-trans isomerase SlyD